MKNVSAALVKAQKQFGPALKSSTNPHFKSKYADLAACVEAVIDALNDHGIALVQRTHPDETGVTIETMFVHESGETISNGTLHVPASKQDPQGYGSALTYARRYSLMAACGIAPEDDDGNAAKPFQKTPSVAQTVLNDAPAIPQDRVDYIDSFGQDIVLEFQRNGTSAIAIAKAIEAEKLNDIEKIYLWNNLPSPMRSAIKEVQTAQRKGVPA